MRDVGLSTCRVPRRRRRTRGNDAATLSCYCTPPCYVYVPLCSTSFLERESVNRPRETIPAIIDWIRFLQTIRADESQILA